MMTKLGNIVASIYLVTKVNKKGIVYEYLDITTGKRIITSVGGLKQNKNNIRALSDDDLEVLAETMTIEKYELWKQGFQDFIKRLCKVVNSYTPPDKNFHPIFVEDGYFVDGFFVDKDNCDYLRVVYPDESLEYVLHKEYMEINIKPES